MGGSGHDWRCRRRWQRAEAEELSGRRLLDRLAEMRSPAGAAQYLSGVRKRRDLAVDDDTPAMILDLLRAIDAEDPMSLSRRSTTFIEWAADEGTRLSTLARFREAVPDELGRLLEDVRRGAEVPTA